jgi:anti-sigma regulatory factor (Ser/Thr protein kinase)
LSESGSYPLRGEADLHDVRRRIRADMAQAGVPSPDVFDCLVAVTEACSNALRHGHGEAFPRLRWQLERDWVRFLVQDFSRERWSRVPRPPGGPALETVDERVGGFGLELMTGLMDQVDIRIGSEGTVVELAKSLPVTDRHG